MKTAGVLIGLLVFSLFSSSLVWAYNPYENSSLTVEVLTPYSYKAPDGTTVVMGEVRNDNNFPVTGVKIGVSFYDANGKTLDYETATTLLKVVLPGGKAPFSISSAKPDPNITDVSVNIAGFVSSSTKELALTVTPGTLQVAEQLSLSGTIKNSGTGGSNSTKVYLISYDVFQRVVGIATADTAPNNIAAGSTGTFSISSSSNLKAKSYTLVAESDNYQSPMTNVTNISIALPVVIDNTSVTDPQGHQYATVPVGAPVKIASELKFLTDQITQPYVYYVQVKRFGGEVEFLGTQQGVFFGAGNQTASVTWIPQSAGQFFIETYVWDPHAVALASPGTQISLVLVKSQ